VKLPRPDYGVFTPYDIAFPLFESGFLAGLWKVLGDRNPASSKFSDTWMSADIKRCHTGRYKAVVAESIPASLRESRHATKQALKAILY
jgi:hypothetical protein